MPADTIRDLLGFSQQVSERIYSGTQLLNPEVHCAPQEEGTEGLSPPPVLLYTCVYIDYKNPFIEFVTILFLLYV